MTKHHFVLLYLGMFFVVLHYFRRSLSQKDRIGKLMRNFLFIALLIIASYSVTLLTNNTQTMSIANSFVFVLLDFLLYNLVEYTIAYTNVPILFKNVKKLFILFFIIDVIVLLTNPWTNFAIEYDLLQIGNDIFAVYQPHLWFDIHLAVCYIMIFNIILIFCYKIYQTPKAYRIRYSMNLILILTVVMLNAIFLYKDYYIDLSIISYGFATIGVYFFTYDYTPINLINNIRNLILENTHNGVMLFDCEQRLITCNSIAQEIYQFSQEELQPYRYHLQDFLEKHDLPFDVQCNIHQTYDMAKTVGNKTRYYQINFNNIFDKHNKFLGNLLVLCDTTATRQHIKQMEHMATHDFLTGLYNRSFYLAIQHEITVEEHYPISYICLNINGLKIINDIYGNSQGDEALRLVSEVVSQYFATNRYIFRFDGDEIVLILYNTLEKDALELMNEIESKIEKIFIQDIQVSAEYGISTILDSSTTLDQAYTKAKTAMSHKKMLNSKSRRSNVIESLKKSLEENNYDTEEHAIRTSQMAVELGQKLGLDDGTLKELELLATLHDIGKLSIPDKILNKPSKLTKEEFEIMKMHTVKGYEIAIITPELSNIANCILHHHERWDGTGYPHGLSKEDIPLLSRIIAVVDSHDVMTHDRVYHKAMPQEEAIAELKRCSGTQFDPNVVEIFLKILDKK